ncbi:NF-kappa-B inhibitor zeta [Embiotoca jacksoni]|uniref:NF-kappa-B inhibitor zeta n=1 Tax=Embiotoca jacksoni TaxID=100190 RepID=UPI003704C79C
MLDPRGNESRGSQVVSTGADFSHNYKGSLITDPSPSGSIQTVNKQSTVKELLMMRRWASEQKPNCSRDDGNLEYKSKYAKYEASGSDTSPPLFGPPALGNPNTNLQFSPVVPTAGVRTTLFHWQIQQEFQKVGGLSLELLNMQDADGDTFLHIAVAQGKRALVYVLAAKMAGCGSLDCKEHNGQTALQIAVATNQYLIVHDLVTLGAQVNTRDLWGRSPLHVCAEKGHSCSLQSIWKSQTGTGQPIDVEMLNYDGLTPLHIAVLSHNAVVKEMKGPQSPCSYMTMELVQRRHAYVECIKTLLQMGASCGTKDLKSGRTCLHMASVMGNVELFGIFLDQPTSLSVVNVKNFSGNTALHIVSSLQNHNSQVEAVKLLMRKGADPGIRNLENELPAQLVPEGPVGEEVLAILKGKRVHA